MAKTEQPKLVFRIVFKQGVRTIAEIDGRGVDLSELKVGDVTERIIETEAYLERLTGLRVHIETA